MGNTAGCTYRTKILYSNVVKKYPNLNIVNSEWYFVIKFDDCSLKVAYLPEHNEDANKNGWVMTTTLTLGNNLKSRNLKSYQELYEQIEQLLEL